MYVEIPDRVTLVDPNSAADFNQLQENIEAMKGGTPSVPPTTTIEDLAAAIAALNSPYSYQGTWDASTNTPTIPAASAGNKGYAYKVGTAGTTTIDGISVWNLGDYLVSNGVSWDRWENVRDKALTVTTGNPSVTNDSANGYIAGDVWINTATQKVYRCMDATTGAAVWIAPLTLAEVQDEAFIAAITFG